MTITLPVSKIPKSFRKTIGLPPQVSEDKKVTFTFYLEGEKTPEKLEVEKSFEVHSDEDFGNMMSWLKNES